MYVFCLPLLNWQTSMHNKFLFSFFLNICKDLTVKRGIEETARERGGARKCVCVCLRMKMTSVNSNLFFRYLIADVQKKRKKKTFTIFWCGNQILIWRFMKLFERLEYTCSQFFFFVSILNINIIQHYCFFFFFYFIHFILLILFLFVYMCVLVLEDITAGYSKKDKSIWKLINHLPTQPLTLDFLAHLSYSMN